MMAGLQDYYLLQSQQITQHQIQKYQKKSVPTPQPSH
jgi:hypothetical protein